MIGDTIRKYRKLKGLTQPELCELLFIHQTHISKIERNIRKPSVDLLAQIQTTLDIPLQELWTNEENAERESALDASAATLEDLLLQIVRFLDEEQKQKLMGYALEQKELKELRTLLHKSERAK